MYALPSKEKATILSELVRRASNNYNLSREVSSGRSWACRLTLLTPEVIKLKPASGTVIQTGIKYGLGKPERIAIEPIYAIATLQDTKFGAVALGATGVARDLQSM
jgi:hypothetical protein